MLIAPFNATTLDGLDGDAYAWTLASVGYEPRAAAVAGAVLPGRRGTAVGFPGGHVLAYDDNAERFETLGMEVLERSDDEFTAVVIDVLARTAVGELRGGDRRPRVAVDVSSMTRTRIAAVVQALAELPASMQIGVDFLYAPATFREPEAPPPAILRRDPVSGFFAGSLAMGDSTVIIGLGYEQHKAASTIEDFGPSRVIAFVPEGEDKRFLEAVLTANAGVLEGPMRPDEERYRLDDPYATLQRLEALCFDALYRDEPRMPVLVPLGPKIFAVCCLLVGALHVEDVAVWRVSYWELEPPVAAQAAGAVYGLRVDVPLLSDG